MFNYDIPLPATTARLHKAFTVYISLTLSYMSGFVNFWLNGGRFTVTNMTTNSIKVVNKTSFKKTAQNNFCDVKKIQTVVWQYSKQ